MIRKTALLIGAAVVATTMGFATPASAQATRTWVSGVGDDVNPCSRTAPCKTFAGAISKTAAGGEINCLDPGGFGAVSIIKSMTISCPYTEGGALAGGNGVVVNLPTAADTVFLRGLDIFGVNPPSNGVRMIAQGNLHIEDSVIRRFNAASSAGISIAPSGAAKVFMSNVTVAENGNAATGGGIVIKPTGSGSVKAELVNVRVRNNANHGLTLDTIGNTGFIVISVSGGNFSGNAGSGILANSSSEIIGMIDDSDSSYNGASGISSTGANTTLRVGNTTITGNGTGVSIVSGVVRTYGDNRLDGNVAGNDGAFTAVILPKR